MEVPYPKSVILICINEFFERFTFYGTRTTLPLFLKDGLGYDEDMATVIFHLFFMFSYFTPLMGASVADCFIGNYRTILYFTLVYIVGSGLLALSAIPVISIPSAAFAIFGLVLIALGSGGIKPCITTFGGDQFRLPQQLTQQLTFFAIFNWVIAAANLSATFVAPMLRADVSCFGESTCFSLMFLVALAFLVVSLIFLVAGKPLYATKEPEGNILVRVAKCVYTAAARKFKKSKVFLEYNKNEKSHWLDVSIDKHGKDLVEEIKVVLGLLPLYIPLCFFWALYDQQSSRWTFQATRMRRTIFGFEFEPDQFPVVNRLMILALIPIFEKIIYPILKRCGLLTSLLTRIFWGGIFAALAFLLSGILEIQLTSKDSTAEEPQVHVLWQLPQFTTMVVAEILFQISGMEFSYSEAPKSMKSLMQAVWLLTSAIGNLIVVFVAKFKFFKKQEYEFFLFTALMLINMVVFLYLTFRYKKRKRESEDKILGPSEGVNNLGYQYSDEDMNDTISVNRNKISTIS